jgi:hypothetical protein
MRSAASTSRSRGTLLSSARTGRTMDAARIGSDAFFEPWMRQAPSSRLPP